MTMIGLWMWWRSDEADPGSRHWLGENETLRREIVAARVLNGGRKSRGGMWDDPWLEATGGLFGHLS